MADFDGGASTLTRPSETVTPALAQHIVDARQFTREWLEAQLFPLARDLQQTPADQLPQLLRGKRLCHLFYEPSTRTRISFEAAMTLLGGSVTSMEGHEQRPDEERLEDRVMVLNEYLYDFLVLRYFEEGGARRAAKVSRIPVINAGDGVGQHPTQALLDVYTIWRELGRLDGLRLALVGDLTYERTTNSLAYVLGLFPGLTIYLVSPQVLRMRDEVRDYLGARGATVVIERDLRSIAGDLDVMYLTRAHSSRLNHAARFDGPAGHFVVDDVVMNRLPGHSVILHPLPRGAELPPECDGDWRVACFRQAHNGLFVRMALLTLLARGHGPDQQ